MLALQKNRFQIVGLEPAPSVAPNKSTSKKLRFWLVNFFAFKEMGR